MTTLPPDAPKLSAVEGMKVESRQLRGTILEDLANPDTGSLSETTYQLLKFHGIYEGYNRDSATTRKKQGLDKEYEFMARIRVPAGRLTAAQYLRLDELADDYSNGTLRITTRQAIQYHCILKKDLWSTIHEINKAQLSTISACGDVVRNITSSPAPIRDAVHNTLRRVVDELVPEVEPKSTAYADIWINGEQHKEEKEFKEVEEPLYGKTYLPRKFKIGVATPEDNSVDVLTNDLAIIALFNGQTLEGFNLALGGGLGMTHNKPETYPYIAKPIVFVTEAQLLDAVKAVIKMQRDHGDRTNRKHARLKYLVAEKGVEWVKAAIEAQFGAPLPPARPVAKYTVIDHMGWHEQGDGLLYLGLPISSGRIQDTETQKIRTGLREVVQKYGIDPILTPNQDIILSNIKPADKAAIEALLRAHNLTFASDISTVSRWAMACPALPTCGLALTEAERVKEPMVASIEAEMQKFNLHNENISIRITGCPNGCARPYAGEIGLVGRQPGFYALYLGGDFEGTRLNERVLDKVPEANIASTLGKAFALYSSQQQSQESFGDFCHRLGADALKAALEAA